MKNDAFDFPFKSLFVPLTTLKAIHWIIIVGFTVYFNALFNGFVGDDFGILVNNGIAHSLGNIQQFFTGGLFNNGNGALSGLYYRPLVLTVYAFLYTFFGGNSFVFHFIQLLLHITNTVIIFLIFKRFIKTNVAFFLSLIFLIHPINADTVDNIANLQDILFALFGLTAFYIVIGRKKKTVNFFFVNLCLFCSFLSKETGMAFVFLILGYCYLFERTKLKMYLISIPLLVVLYGLIHYAVVGVGFHNNQPFPIMRLSLPDRLLNIPAIVFYYFKTFFYPADLAVDYKWIITNISFFNFYLPFLFILLVLISLVLLFFRFKKRVKQYKLYIFFSMWLIIGMLFHIQIIPLDVTVTNRFFYFPMIGLLGLFGTIFIDIKIKKAYSRKIIFLVLSVVILLLAIRTIIRNENWKNGIILAEHDLKYSPENYSLESYLGTEYYKIGNYDQAQKHFMKSTELAPYWYLSWYYWGLVLEKKWAEKGDKKLLDNAKQKFRIAIKNSVNDSTAFEDMAYLLIFSGDPTAKNFLDDSLKKYPNSSGLWYNMAVLDLTVHDRQKALLDVKKALYFNPGNQEAGLLYTALINGSPVNMQIK